MGKDDNNNMHYLFYVQYYEWLEDTIDQSAVTEANSNLVKKINDSKLRFIKWENERNERIKRYDSAYCTFELKTRYPGILIGIGNNHQAGRKGEIALGYTFDYVTGAPYLPASSVKGIIRSAFEHREYIKDLLEDIIGRNNLDVEALEKTIFEGYENNEMLLIGQRDIFYDASISGTKNDNNIMDLDAITPHNKEMETPNPITMLRIVPDVMIRFGFSLKKSVIDNTIVTAEHKLELFKQILLDFGVGAKTNVGYGVLTDE